MKKTILRILATTSISLLVLSIFATFFGAKYLMISSVFETFGANIMIHLGFYFTHKFESQYFVLEVLLDMAYVSFILILFGFIFNWFHTRTPIGILLVIGVVVYGISCLLQAFRIWEEINTINQLLDKRNHNMDSDK